MAPKEVNFGKSFAVLNLDLMGVLIDAVRPDPSGQTFISNCSRWIDAVHGMSHPPLTIFTSLCFSDASQPELKKDAPFARLIEPFDTFLKGIPATDIAPEFAVDDTDMVLQKTRWSASSGNDLLHILREAKIDTVIISGLTLSGVVMSTVYHLFDHDYNIFVISDNVVELPLDQTETFSKIMLENLLPKMNCRAITLEEALEALKKGR